MSIVKSEIFLVGCILFFSIFSAQFLSAQPSEDEIKKWGEVIKGRCFEGLIVKYLPTEFEKKNRTPPGWTPSRDLVLSIEDDLKNYIEMYGKTSNADKWIVEHLSEYKLQYWGYTEIKEEELRKTNFLHKFDKRTLQINFNHISEVPDGEWKIPFGVLGGGHYFFTISYDLESKQFTGPWINAPE